MLRVVLRGGLGLDANSERAAATTAAAVIPRFSITRLPGALVPKASMPSALP